jgi:hypothetical protein
VLEQLLAGAASATLPQAESPGDRCGHEPRITQWRQVDKHHAVPIGRAKVRGDGDREACLANSSWPNQRQQPHRRLGWLKQRPHRRELFLTADQRRQPGWQLRGVQGGLLSEHGCLAAWAGWTSARGGEVSAVFGR